MKRKKVKEIPKKKTFKTPNSKKNIEVDRIKNKNGEILIEDKEIL